MITIPTAAAHDPRVQIKDERVSAAGNVWTVTGRFDPRNGMLKLHRIEGDVTNRDALHAMARQLVDTIGSRSRS